MIQSMTGYGAIEHVEGNVSYAMELRSVNHRYLKLSIKLPDHLQFAETAVEKVLRARLSRGSVSCSLRVRSQSDLGPCPINLEALQNYVDQLSRVRVPAGIHAGMDLGAIASLPGVIHSPDLDDDARQRQLSLVEELTARAADVLVEMRKEEGQALCKVLLEGCAAMRAQLDEVGLRGPHVIDEYHERLQTRVSTLMKAGGFELEAEGLMREVAVFAERCDISEEVTRLRSHLDQFAGLCDRSEPIGRTLDFLTQELLREANTVASKCNDAPIARCVVETKAIIDRLKEQVQNVE